jgi:hypothetical protein
MSRSYTFSPQSATMACSGTSLLFNNIICSTGWRKLYNEELHNFYCSPDIIRMVKSISMRWTGHVAHMKEMRNAYKIFSLGSVE